MNKWILAILCSMSATAAAAADVGVSIQIGQPGFYGRIDIGDLPHPELIFPQPLIIKPVVGVVRPPLYLHVPPGHAKDWAKHCNKYNACGERVFFVQDHWYNNVYVPQYQKRHGKPNRDDRSNDHPGKGHGKGKHGD